MLGGLEVVVSERSADPTKYWEMESPNATVMRFKMKTPRESAPANKARVVCLSDTHSMTSHMSKSIPEGDILVHAGDFTRCGHVSEVKQFNAWLQRLPHPHKIVIAGNHELSFDDKFFKKQNTINTVHQRLRSNHTGDHMGVISSRPDSARAEDNTRTSQSGWEDVAADDEVDPALIKNELIHCTYLQDASTTVFGLKIYGTPWQPEYYDWAFNLKRGQPLLDKWSLIPDDTDILITHTPPVGYGDLCSVGTRAGCVDLLRTVQKRVRPKYHIYGHIHEGYGVRSDGRTVFVNASICDLTYNPCNKPIVFDIPIPEGFTKS